MVTPETIAVALGVAAPPEDSQLWDQWELWIADAAMLIQARADRMGVDIADIDEARVDYVEREAVAAHVRRPDDATTVLVSVDDGSTQKTYQSASGRVQIRDEWWELLGLVEDGQAFGVDLVRANVRGMHVPWCDAAWGASCSCGVNLAGEPLWERP